MFEILVEPGFSPFELSAILSVLQTANEIQSGTRFDWHITSPSPGLVNSRTDMLVRAEPAIATDYLRDYLFVISGINGRPEGWLPRVRAMQKLQRPVFLLAEAARDYIKIASPIAGPVTAHWRDARTLTETGDYPTLSQALVENNSGIHTCAGRAHTAEIVIRLLAETLSPQYCAELTSAMILETARGFSGDQPSGAGQNANFLGSRLVKAIAVMEQNIEHPLRTAEIADQAGISIRQLERLFLTHVQTTPAKYYTRLRLKQARKLASDTKLTFLEIAIACGFSSSTALSNAFQREFGLTPRQARKGDTAIAP
ncbi:GlxA family transcriptional regulator [Roseovarius sp. C7]|uniref:GlxA family transcriptional regulator n=1 Tax=Roseovarius sp. C7 TaxID=3398643 RepID=UPI0039F689BE